MSYPKVRLSGALSYLIQLKMLLHIAGGLEQITSKCSLQSKSIYAARIVIKMFCCVCSKFMCFFPKKTQKNLKKLNPKFKKRKTTNNKSPKNTHRKRESDSSKIKKEKNCNIQVTAGKFCYQELWLFSSCLSVSNVQFYNVLPINTLTSQHVPQVCNVRFREQPGQQYTCQSK